MKRLILISALLIGLLSIPLADSYGHSGGTNAAGCHTNRKTGDYHCHTRKTPPPNKQTYCHMLNGERRCGYARSTCIDLKNKYGGYCAAG